MSLSSRLGTRFKAEFIGQTIAIIAGALLTVVLARLLNPDGYGLLFLAISVFSIAQIFSKLGLANSGARYIAQYRADDPGQVPHIIRQVVTYNVIAIILISLGFLMIHPYLADILGEPDLSPLLALGALYIAVASIVTIGRMTAQGFEDIQLAASIHAVDRGTRLLFAVGFVLLGFETLGALAGFVIAAGIAGIGGLVMVYVRHYRRYTPAPSIEPGLKRRILEYNVPLIAASFSGKFDKQVDTILVGFFLNPVAVSYYVLGKQIAGFVQFPSNSLGFSISPTYGSLKASEDRETAARLFETSLNHTLLLYVPAGVGIFLIADPAVGLIFGVGYTGAVPVLQVLSVYVVLSAITNIVDYPLDYLGLAKLRAYAKGIASGSNVILNILLIPWIGVVGAAIATVITHSFYVSVKLYLVSSELPLSSPHIIRNTGLVLVVSCVMGLTVLLLEPFITGIASMSIVIGIGIGIWAVVSIALGAMDLNLLRKLIVKADT